VHLLQQPEVVFGAGGIKLIGPGGGSGKGIAALDQQAAVPGRRQPLGERGADPAAVGKQEPAVTRLLAASRGRLGGACRALPEQVVEKIVAVFVPFQAPQAQALGEAWLRSS